MIPIVIPGRGALKLEHLVSDVNGTFALEGTCLDAPLAADLVVPGILDALSLLENPSCLVASPRR